MCLVTGRSCCTLHKAPDPVASAPAPASASASVAASSPASTALLLNGEAKELKVFSISSVSAPARRSELVQNYV